MDKLEMQFDAYEKRTGIKLDAHQREVYRAMLQGKSVADQLNKQYEAEWNNDKIHGYDDGEAQLEANDY